MTNRLLFLFFVLFFCSCFLNRQPAPYKGYAFYADGVYYKYADLGIKRGRISPGKTMEVFMNYSRINDSVFWDSRDTWEPFTILLPYDTLTKSNTYLKILLKCNEGDSMNFILRKNLMSTAGLHPHPFVADSMVKVNVRIVAILDSTQLKRKMEKYASIIKDKEMKEQYELSRYLENNNIPDSDKVGNIYLVPVSRGSGPEVVEGNHVSISYKGYFINHKTFDSIPPDDPLDFIIGDSGQVISGLETGIKKMREGEIAKIIIPSHSAFGEKGSSTGIVPPYTTLIYEVTIVKVKTGSEKNN